MRQMTGSVRCNDSLKVTKLAKGRLVTEVHIDNGSIARIPLTSSAFVQTEPGSMAYGRQETQLTLANHCMCLVLCQIQGWGGRRHWVCSREQMI